MRSEPQSGLLFFIVSVVSHCGVAFDRWSGALVACVSLLMVSRV